MTTGETLPAGSSSTVVTRDPGQLVQDVGSSFDPSRWDSVRAEFSLDPEWADFTAFMLSSHPRPVQDAIRRFSDRINLRPEWAELAALAPPDDNPVQQAKRSLAGYLGGSPDEFALVQNTTVGLGVLYNGLDLAAGDQVLLSEHDHYSHHIAATRKAEQCGAELRFVRLYDDPAAADPAEMVVRLTAALTPRTRVVGLTSVHSCTGVRMPVREATQAIRAAVPGRPPVIVVDGVHSCGVVNEPIDDLGADFFISGVHKWLHGPRGTGFIWGARESWPAVRPTIPTFEMDADVFGTWIARAPLPSTKASYVSPGGFVAYEYLFAIPDAIAFLSRIGLSRISERVLTLNHALREGLAEVPGVQVASPRNPALASGIVCFDIDGLDPSTVVDGLTEYRVRAATTPYARSYARLAATIANTEPDIDRAVAAVADIAARARGGTR